MRSKVIRIAIAVVLAAVGTVVLIRYVESARDEAVAAEVVVPVLVVVQPIDKDTPAAELEGKVELREVPEKVRVQGAVSDLAALKNLHTSVALAPGEQLIESRFVSAGEAARGIAPPNMLQVTITLDAERALGGLVRPGDRVRVLLTGGANASGGAASPTPAASTDPDLQKILVVKVQGEVSPGETAPAADGVDPPPAGSLAITLAVSDTLATKLANLKAEGRIWLAMEPDDLAGPAAASGATTAPATGGAS